MSRPLFALAALSMAFGQCQDSQAHAHGHETEAPASATVGPARMAEMPGMNGPTDHSQHMPPGYADFEMDRATFVVQGLETARVESGATSRKVHTVGVVTFDETRTSHVHAKVKGFVEVLQADFVGKKVKRGEALCAVFSQSVVAAQLEYAAIAKSRKNAANALGSNGGLLDDAMLDAARQRLALLDVPPALLDQIERSGAPARDFYITAPRAGTVVAKEAVLGSYVELGTELFTISDLSRVWAQIDVYESDVADVAVGQRVELTIEGTTGGRSGTIDFLSPTIDGATRTLRARVEIDNADERIRPGAFVQGDVTIAAGSGLTVPKTAVIRTGVRDIVYVVHESHVQPREVRLGPALGDRYRVDEGLGEGEEVATGAQFLIDAESRLRASSGKGAGHAGHGG